MLQNIKWGKIYNLGKIIYGTHWENGLYKKNIKWTSSSEWKTFVLQKTLIIKKKKTQETNWEKIFEHMFNMRLLSWIHKELL